MQRSFFQDDIEQNQHEEAISRLCNEYPDQSELIRKNYLETLEPLIAEACIRTYLPIFVSRKVKSLLEEAQKTTH